MKVNKTELDSRAVQLKDALLAYYDNLDKLDKVKIQYEPTLLVDPNTEESQVALEIRDEMRNLKGEIFENEETVINTVKWFRSVGYPNALKEWCKLNKLATKLDKFKKTHKIK